MATYPLMKKNVTSKTTTVTDQATDTQTSKALTTSSRSLITREQVTDPGQLIQLLNAMQDGVAKLTQASASNPHSSPSIVRNVPVSNGAVIVVRHSLGRALTGWWVCRARSTAAEFYELGPNDPNYPQGLDETKALVLVANCAGLFDFCITGD